MDKRDIFFGEAGLTSTSANHIANMAKELILVKDALVENLHFVDRTVQFIESKLNEPIAVSKGKGEEDLTEIKLAYDDIYRSKALIAWLREAIKAKESFTDETRALTIEEYCEKQGIEIPEHPDRKPDMTEDEYYASLPMKERVRYYTLETKCAVLGQALHPVNGGLYKGRRELVTCLTDPITMTVKNGVPCVEKTEPSIPSEALDTFFFAQNVAHREAQSELNTIKFACEKTLTEDSIAKQTEYNKALQDYNAKMKTLNNELALYKRKRMKEINTLKIVIPDSLKPIFDKVNSLGKSKKK